MEVTAADKNCSEDTNAGTGKECRHSLFISRSELEASEKDSMAQAASAK